MLGLELFIFVSISSLVILVWIRAATFRNSDDLCESCKNRKYLNGKDYDNSPCFHCTKNDSKYELDKKYIKGDNI